MIAYRFDVGLLAPGPSDEGLYPLSRIRWPGLTSDPHVVSLIALFTRYVSPLGIEAYTYPLQMPNYYVHSMCRK